jgi:hypothetical protein
MLGRIAAAGNYETLRAYIKMIGPDADFRKNSRDQWRFFLEEKEVDSKALQRELFFAGGSGLRGQWTKEQRTHAERVCALLSMMWQEPSFRKAQEDYTGERLLGFAMAKSKKILFPENFPTEGWDGALRAAFTSFAANLPAVADEHFRIAYEKAGDASIEDLTIEALREMTFGPGISIYPHRYNAIRPVLEKQFGIDLPDFAKELEQFEYQNPWAELYPTVAHFQTALLELGIYDLGPSGADNKMGKLTKAAIAQFEEDHNLPVDGKPDRKFAEALRDAVNEARENGLAANASTDVEEEVPEEDPFDAPDPDVPDVMSIPDPRPPGDGHSTPPPPTSEPVPKKSSGAAKTTGIVVFVVGLLGALWKLFSE